MRPCFYKQPCIFRRKTWAKIRVKISQCTVHVGAWRVWPHQLFSLCLSSPGTALLVQQHSHTAGNYKMELQHLTVCCISLSLHTLFISALPLGHLSVLIPPRTPRFHHHFITILCCRIFPILNQSYRISCRGKLKNIHIVILDHLYILIFFYQSQISFCNKVQNISLTAVSDVDYMLSGSGAALSSLLLQPPPAAAVIQFWYRPAGRLKEFLPHLDMWAWPWRSSWLTEKFCGCPSAPRGGGQMCVQIWHIRVAANIQIKLQR